MIFIFEKFQLKRYPQRIILNRLKSENAGHVQKEAEDDQNK